MKYLILLAFGLWLGWRAKQWAQTLQTGPKAPSPSSRPAVVETLLMCERCGVHVPQSRVQQIARGRYRCVDVCPEGAQGDTRAS